MSNFFHWVLLAGSWKRIYKKYNFDVTKSRCFKNAFLLLLTCLNFTLKNTYIRNKLLKYIILKLLNSFLYKDFKS